MNDNAKHIGLDAHQATISAILDSAGKLVMEAILGLKAHNSPVCPWCAWQPARALEEGTWAAWWHDLLTPHSAKGSL